MAFISYAEQTYGPKGSVKILRNMHVGSTKTFNLIDKLKSKIFNMPLDPSLAQFSLVQEKSPLILNFDEKEEMIEALN